MERRKRRKRREEEEHEEEDEDEDMYACMHVCSDECRYKCLSVPIYQNSCLHVYMYVRIYVLVYLGLYITPLQDAFDRSLGDRSVQQQAVSYSEGQPVLLRPADEGTSVANTCENRDQLRRLIISDSTLAAVPLRTAVDGSSAGNL